VSDAFLHNFWALGMSSSAHATIETAKAFSFTDFREDLKAVTVPTLIIHGDGDKTVPIEASSERTAKLIPQAQYLIYGGAPHGLWYTHKEQFNADLIAFIKDGVVQEPFVDYTQPLGNFPGLSY
ncbi:MAG: alpha/beta hydrolase, partial [Chitinophagaceae bacterium]